MGVFIIKIGDKLIKQPEDKKIHVLPFGPSTGLFVRR